MKMTVNFEFNDVLDSEQAEAQALILSLGNLWSGAKQIRQTRAPVGANGAPSSVAADLASIAPELRDAMEERLRQGQRNREASIQPQASNKKESGTHMSGVASFTP